MKLLEVSVETDGEAAEAVSAVFSQYGQGGAVFEEVWDGVSQSTRVQVKTFLSVERSAELTQVEEALWHLGQILPIPSPTVRWLSQADWTEAWRSGYRAQRIGKRTVIKPSWRPYSAKPGQVVIELDPGLAFGTGLHPSTRLVLEALESHLQPGDRVLDVGTGSGILAIAAAKHGAAAVVGLDVDELALEVARENITRNGVQETVSVQRASLSALPGSDGSDKVVEVFDAHGEQDGAFDLLLMNILAHVICAGARAIVRCLAPQGRFIVSGIIASQEENVCRALSAADLKVVGRHCKKDWVALIGRKEDARGEVV